MLQQRLCVDMMGRMAESILLSTDKTSMANSLEVRLPFLDRHVVEFALSLPSDLKLRGEQEKYLLSKITHRLPRELRTRRKQGLQIPLEGMIKTPLGLKHTRELILGSSAVGELFQARALEKWVRKTFAGKMRDLTTPWRLIVLSVWWEQLGEYRSLAQDSERIIRKQAA